MRASEAARVLGVSPASIRRWAAQGRIPSDRTFGGHRRFSLAEVQGALAGRNHAPSSGGLRDAVVEYLTARVSEWTVPPIHMTLFGSVARDEDGERSDIDVFAIEPPYGNENDRKAFGYQVLALVESTGETFDRDLRAVVLSLDQLERVANGPNGLLLDVLHDGILLAGTPLEALLRPFVGRMNPPGAA